LRRLLPAHDYGGFVQCMSRKGNCWDNAVAESFFATLKNEEAPHAGRKAFTLQTLPSAGDDERPAARANGFSLHAGVVAAADQRAKLERLCRTIARPAVSTERLSLATQGLIHYRLKTPYRDGTTHVVFEPLDFLARLASLVPTPRVNLTRYR